MGRKKPRTGVIVAIVAVIAIIAVIFGMGGCSLQAGTIVGQSTSDTTTTFSTANCPDDGITSINVKVEDIGAATETFAQDSQFHIKNVDAGVIEASSETSSSAWVSSDITCGKNYKVYVVTNQSLVGSAESDVIQADEDKEYVKLETNKLANITAKYKDVAGDDWEYLSTNGNVSASITLNTTTGIMVNSTWILEGVTLNPISVGTDGYLDGYFELKSQDNRKSVNDQGMKGQANPTRLDLKNYFCVDLNGATNGQEWDSDSLKVSLSDGVALPNVISSIDSKSREYVDLQKCEACYEIGDINDIFKRVNFYVKAKSGEDPDSTDDDINVYVYSEGTYKSNLNGDEIKTGIFTDASTQLGVVHHATAQNPKLIFQII